MVADITPGAGSSTMGEYTAVNDALFFWADDGAFDRELWRSNGGPLGPGGTARVADINPGGPGADPESLTNVNGTLFFSADDGTTGIELWKATTEGPAAPATPTPAMPAKPKKKCKKGRKLKKGKCVKKKRKK
jgi:ELWxxDGT repeat protein